MQKISPVEKLRAYRNDIILFCREAFRLEPTDQQAQVLMSFQNPGSWTSVRSGHGTGKTASMALCAAWHTLLWAPCKTIVTAPTYPQLKDAFMPELNMLVERAAPWVKNSLRLTSDRMMVAGNEEGQFMSARTARHGEESSLQGARARYTAYIVDECYGVSEAVFSVITGASSRSGTTLKRAERSQEAAFRLLMGGNPTRSSGYAYDSHNKNRALFTSIRLNSEESPLVGSEFLKRLSPLKGTDEYRIRVLGEHPLLSANTLLPRALLEEAAKRKYSPVDYEHAPLLVGCDPAWMGSDRSAVVLRQGLWSKVHFVRQGVDSVELAGVINELWNTGEQNISLIRPIGLIGGSEYPADATPHKGALSVNGPCGHVLPSAIFIDTGMGNGVIDQLRRLGRNPIPVSFGGASLRDDCYLKRTEMWVKMAEWLKAGGALENNEELLEELCGVEYAFNLMGKKVLESKDVMRERTGRSPDIADALALTFAFEVAAPSEAGTDYRRGKEEPYDPWREFDGA
jgi:hypothetical protein